MRSASKKARNLLQIIIVEEETTEYISERFYSFIEVFTWSRNFYAKNDQYAWSVYIVNIDRLEYKWVKNKKYGSK